MSTFKRVDWSQLWYPGRKTPFTADELARAGNDPPGPTLLAVSALNLALLALLVLQIAPAEQTPRLLGFIVALGAAGYCAGRWLWRNPWRRPLLLVTLGLCFGLGVVAGLVRLRMPEREERMALGLLLALCGGMVPVLLWFLAVWRAHQIEARLREYAEREKAIEMARRLATAQIEPHFLFNTLSSVQHWVQTKDERAAPLLAALTGYLRATLPLFNRPLLALQDELAAVRQYLCVMQLRMGARLAWQLDVPDALHALMLPPGVLLTLVENAVVHGLEPAVAGGTLAISARAEAGHAAIEVRDSGVGAAAGFHEGLGLANVRERLQLAFGNSATLALASAPGAGFSARLQVPLQVPLQLPPPTP